LGTLDHLAVFSLDCNRQYPVSSLGVIRIIFTTYNYVLKQMKRVINTANDKMQNNYNYLLAEYIGTNFHPEFKPQLTPLQMLEMGIFGGRYMRDCKEEFPDEWFTKAKLLPIGKQGHDKKLNFFKINASQPLSIWRKKGWIHPDDPRGWFQWYCRYYMGRRHEDDSRQIRRWKAMNRHISQIYANCRARDLLCRPRQRQAVLHWAYDSRLM